MKKACLFAKRCNTQLSVQTTSHFGERGRGGISPQLAFQEWVDLPTWLKVRAPFLLQPGLGFPEQGPGQNK